MCASLAQVDTPLDEEVKTQLIQDIIRLIDPLPYDRHALALVVERRIRAQGFLSMSRVTLRIPFPLWESSLKKGGTCFFPSSMK